MKKRICLHCRQRISGKDYKQFKTNYHLGCIHNMEEDWFNSQISEQERRHEQGIELEEK